MEQNNVSTGHPKGLALLFATEMWERFSYYGMRALFSLYMMKALLFDKALASAIYGDYTGLVYLTPLIGGLVADRYWGNRKSIIFGGALMAIGQFFMFASGMVYTNPALATPIMFLGLLFLIIGNGFFKPNISTMVGQLYPKGDSRVDSAFTIFYMGINAGALLAPLVCGGIGDTGDPGDFKYGFLAACIGMVVSLIIFIFLKNKYIVTPEGKPIGTKPEKKPKEETDAQGKGKSRTWFWIGVFVVLFIIFKGFLAFDLIGTIIYASCIVAPASIISDPSLSKIERSRVWVIYILAFFVIFFWAAFEQAGASLTFFAEEQTDRTIFGWEVPASYFQSINPVAIVVLAPIFAILWTWLGKRKKEPASPLKQAIGLFLLSIGYVVIAIAVKDLNPATKVSLFWLFSLYLIHTMGELCLSPIGLSMVVKLAPVRFSSLLMGVWFLSTATANKFAGDLSALYPEEVKLEKTVVLGAFNFGENTKADISGFAGGLTLSQKDSDLWVSLKNLENKVWTPEYASAKEAKPEEPKGMDKFIANMKADPLVEVLTSDAKKDNLENLTIKGEAKAIALPEHKKKQVLPKGRHITGKSEDGNTLFIIKTEKDELKKGHEIVKLETWNLEPKKPVFMSFPIRNLYEFFLIFVVMSGVASIFLFFLSKKLLKMMHGLR